MFRHGAEVSVYISTHSVSLLSDLSVALFLDRLQNERGRRTGGSFGPCSRFFSLHHSHWSKKGFWVSAFGVSLCTMLSRSYSQFSSLLLSKFCAQLVILTQFSFSNAHKSNVCPIICWFGICDGVVSAASTLTSALVCWFQKDVIDSLVLVLEKSGGENIVRVLQVCFSFLQILLGQKTVETKHVL